MKKEYTGLFIPKEILEDKNLNGYEKIVLSEIFQLSKNEQKKAFFSNKHLSQNIGLTIRQIKRIISNLKNKNLIQICGYTHSRKIYCTKKYDKLSTKSGPKAKIDNELSTTYVPNLVPEVVSLRSENVPNLGPLMSPIDNREIIKDNSTDNIYTGNQQEIFKRIKSFCSEEWLEMFLILNDDQKEQAIEEAKNFYNFYDFENGVWNPKRTNLETKSYTSMLKSQYYIKHSIG